MDIPLADLEAPVPKRRGRRWFWVAAIVVVIAISAAVVATTGSGSKSPLAVLTAASGRTTSSGTARMTSVETLTTNGETFEVVDIAGATDFARKASSLTMSSRGKTVLEIRAVAGVSYMSSPLADLPDGAHWVSVRPADLKLTDGGSALGSNDPSTGLRYLSAIKGDPKVVGHEQIDGTDTTHYTFTLDLKAFLAKTAKAADALGSSPLGSLDQLDGIIDLTKLPGAAWIDAEGRMRQFEFSMAASQGGESMKVVSTMKFSHFDEPVSVSAPDPSDTVPFSQDPTFFTDLGSSTV